jgi:hypothetical protein
MQTGLIKRRDSKLLLISTAAAQLDSPLGRLRARALVQPSAKRTGAVVEAKGHPALARMVPPRGPGLGRLQAVKTCNPAPWITVSDLRRQRAAVPDTAFARFHACRWGVGEARGCPGRVAGLRRRARVH